MPSSSPNQLTPIANAIARLQPASVLDVGCGFGKYGVLCRELLDVAYKRFTPDTWRVCLGAVEACRERRASPVVRAVYDAVFEMSVQEYVAAHQDQWDLILMIDVIEHMTQVEGQRCLRQLLARCQHMIVATPLYDAPQEYHTEWDRHQHFWKEDEFPAHRVLLPGPNLVILLRGGFCSD